MSVFLAKLEIPTEVLSVLFLRLANSASLGLRRSVDSLDRAMVMLGRNQVESMLIGQAVVGKIK